MATLATLWKSPTARFSLGGAVCVALLITAAWFQFVKGLAPCPLCISQRAMVLLTGLAFFLGAFHRRFRKGYGIAAIAFALGGAAIAARHVWLQHLPEDEVPACGPGLAYVFHHFPLSETVRLLLSGTGECSEIVWTFLGWSLPTWTLVAFLGLAAWGGFSIRRAR